MAEVNNVRKWLETNIIPKVVENIDNERNRKYTVLWTQLDNCYFLSDIYFADIIVGDDEEKSSNTLFLVLKIPPQEKETSKKLHTNNLFHNEIVFYNKIANNSPKYPKFYYGTADDIDNTVIVLENLSKRGFKMCPQLYDIPLQYVMSAVRELGRFHGMGYVMKERHPENLTAVVESLREGRFISGSPVHTLINIVATRPVEWLRKTNYDTVFCEKMEKYFGDAFHYITLDAMKPIEPLAVLLHGDFTRSNMLFIETSSGVETMLIDFGMIRYGSPAIDLSTLLFLNASTESRREHFNEIFKAYHNSLLEYLEDAGLSHLGKYSLENMLADYKRRAAYGYIISLFFLPFLCGFCDDLSDDENIEKRAMKVKESGGDVLSEKFVEMLLELRDTGCLNHFL